MVYFSKSKTGLLLEERLHLTSIFAEGALAPVTAPSDPLFPQA